MRVSVVGTGYVGTVLAVALADLGHDLLNVDIDENKIRMINEGKSPIFEKGLQELMDKNKGRIRGTINLKEAMLQTDLTFICVGTPSGTEGQINLEQIEGVCNEIGRALAEKQDKHYIVIKSTILPGTSEKCIKIIEEASGKKFPDGFSLAFNPEFLREGNAIHDIFNQDRIIVGSEDKEIFGKVKEVYKGLNSPFIETKFKEAEMIKYANNSFLATKLSFINEIGNICKKLKIDTNVVAKGIGMDFRIAKHFLKSGIGFGGSCFPKDVSALAHKAREIGYEPRLLKSVLDINEDQPKKIVEILKRKDSIDGKKIALLGLAFKAGTDDVRESPSLQIIKELLLDKPELYVYDPVAMGPVKKMFPSLNYVDNAQEAVDNSDIVLLLTEWDEFTKLNYGEKIVIDGKNVFSEKDLKPKNYEGICW